MSSPLYDLSEVLAGVHAVTTAEATLAFHMGQIITWDSDSNTNTVLVLGTVIPNVPVLTSANTTGLEVGASVGILKVRTRYFILGRIVDQSSGLINPQFPIVLYPQFISNGTASTIGQSRVNTGVLATWEGRIKVSFPFVEIDGVWGNLSGSGSTTYAIKLGGTTVGSWTATTLSVGRRGPYDVRSFTGQDWLKIELAITASTGTGEKAFQPLGCYFRDA